MDNALCLLSMKGKSLYARNLIQLYEENLQTAGFTSKTIRISESHLRSEDIALQLQPYEDAPMSSVPRILHFDIPPVVSMILFYVLFYNPNAEKVQTAWKTRI